MHSFLSSAHPQAGLAAVRFACRTTCSLTLVAKNPQPIVPNTNYSLEIRPFDQRINAHRHLCTRHPCLPKASTRHSIAKTLRTIDQSSISHSSQLQQIRPRIRMAAAPALFATTTKPITISRPTGAAKLNKIDFNPGVRASDPGASTPVVIMHGLLGNSRNFQGWGTKLVKSLDKERRVFAVDMRNHGGSSHHGTMTYVDMANDILGFLADEGLSEAVLVGHSMGGKAAAMTALLHPQVVRGLVVMDIAPVSYSMVDSTNWGETKKIIEAIHKMPLEGVESRRDADQRLAKDVVDPALRAFAVTNLDKDAASGRWDWRINIDVIQRSMGDLARFDSRRSNPGSGERGFERLPTTGGVGSESEEFSPYTGDTLFVAGGNSRYVRSQHLAEIRNLFPTFVVSTVKGAGHWVHADNPEETLRLVKSFLDRPELP